MRFIRCSTPPIIILSMEKSQLRNQRFANIRMSLINNPAILATTARLSEKMEKKQRRTSIQYGNNDPMLPTNCEEFLSDDEDTTSSLFHEKYTLGEKAGEGAHGVVKQCIDKKTGQLLAVKTVTLQREHIVHMKTNFLQIRQLTHPHILTYKSIFFQLKNARCYLVMDYLPFQDLNQNSISSEEELKQVVYQLLETVKYLHDHKICHRDIKPDNILYDRPNKNIKIIDFGISKKIEERGRKREMLTLTGTPYYRAPEMFEGGGYDEMVDMWAVGITIYKLITGFTPFESEYHSDTINNIVKGQLIFPEKLKFQCSQAPKNLIKRLLRKNKKERLTAEEALKDLWFVHIKPKDQLIRSMTLESNEPAIDCLKMSMKLQQNAGAKGVKENQPIQMINSEKRISCFKKVPELEVNIYGLDDDNLS